MTTSAAVFKAVKTKLVADAGALAGFALATDENASPDAVLVTWGDPGGKLERQHLWFDGMRPEEQNWTAIGNLQRGTKFEIDLRIVVHKKGATQQEVDERALDILDLFEAYLRLDPELGLSLDGVLALIVDLGGWELIPAMSDQTREAWVDARVRVSARIEREA